MICMFPTSDANHIVYYNEITMQNSNHYMQHMGKRTK
uniref:Uncharacterized protein n=1 Tax=Rhizophora mucronata TaxID=61149 RepID=A0A2P2R442_RHIMU